MKLYKYLKHKQESLSEWWFYYKLSKQRKREENAALYCYKKLYKKATPSADFKKLMKSAEINERGQKVLHFMDYYLEMEEQEKIIAKTIKKYKLSSWSAKGLRLSILLGCSPTSYKKEEDGK